MVQCRFSIETFSSYTPTYPLQQLLQLTNSQNPSQAQVYRPKKQWQNRAQSLKDEPPNSSDEENINFVITTPPKSSHSLDKSQLEASGESLRNTPFSQETAIETPANFSNPSLAMTVTPDVPENIAPSSTASQFHNTALAQTPAPKPYEHTQMLPGELPQTHVTELETSNEGSESETVGRPQRNRQQPEQLTYYAPGERVHCQQINGSAAPFYPSSYCGSPSLILNPQGYRPIAVQPPVPIYLLPYHYQYPFHVFPPNYYTLSQPSLPSFVQLPTY